MRRTAILVLAACSLTLPGARAEAPTGFAQHAGAQLPVDVGLTDEGGRTVPWGEALAGRPAVLVFGYFRCPQLCSVVEQGTIDALRDLQPSVGADFSYIYVSIDPTDTPEAARDQRRAAIRLYGRAGGAEGWHFFTGTPAAVGAVAAAAGFDYRFDPATRQYAHPSGILVLTPTGRISQYFLGLDFDAAECAAALRRAAAGQTGPTGFALVLECFRGGRISGRYGALIWRGLELAVALTLVGLAGGIGWMLRAEFAARRRVREGTG